MLALADLRRPIVGAPMAGGVSTPELAAAVSAAGGLGFLAAGYLPVATVVDQVRSARALGAEALGVNLFVPEATPPDLDAARAYRRTLLPLAERLGVELPDPRPDDDGWDAKVAALLDDPVPVVSFTFGLAPADVVARLSDVGTCVLATVVTAEDAARAAATGVDGLVVQGPGAGGHRATTSAQGVPPDQPLPDLLAAVRAATDLPIVATGGLSDAASVARALELADAVQVGTALLDAEEAGTNPTYRAALRDPRFTRTTLTRAFSGRVARGLDNRFIREHLDAPAVYPAVNQLTGPLRRAAGASGDADGLSLWAGTGWRAVRGGPAAAIVDALLAGPTEDA